MSSSGPLSKQFSWKEYSFLSNDSFKRFKPSDPYIAYALVSYNSDGVPVAHDFKFPTMPEKGIYYSNSKMPPTVKNLIQISLGRSTDGEVIKATTIDNEIMTTQRSIHFQMHYKDDEPIEYSLFFFSPRSDSTESQNLAWDSLNQYHDCEYLVGNDDIRGGEIEISYDSFQSEDHSSTSSIDFLEPSDVMGRSAIDAYAEFQHDNYQMLSYTMNRILNKSISVYSPYGRSMATYKRPEWCHAIGRQFFPNDIDPNEPWNLGAAPKWMNSQMMIFEESLKWHAQRYPEADTRLCSRFQMFDGSDVVYRGEMDGIIKKGDRTISMHQSLLPHQLYPAYPQATDIAICTFVLNGLLLGKDRNRIDCTVLNREQAIDHHLESAVSAVAQQVLLSPTVEAASSSSLNLKYFDESIKDEELNELLEKLDNHQNQPVLTFAGVKRRSPDKSNYESIGDDEIAMLFDKYEEKKWKVGKSTGTG